VRREDVVAIEVSLYGTALDYQSADPRTELAARFSVPAIVHASLAPEGLRGPALADFAAGDAEARDWARCVSVRHDPELDAGYPSGRPTRVTVTTKDGRTRTFRVQDVRGDSALPLSEAELMTKVRAALSRRFEPTAVEGILRALGEFVAGGTVHGLTAVLRTAAEAPRP
jgi:2-methylcitrate dehydratase PrpD